MKAVTVIKVYRRSEEIAKGLSKRNHSIPTFFSDCCVNTMQASLTAYNQIKPRTRNQ